MRDADLQFVVNALWAAGAEAVSINGQRLVRLPPSGSPARPSWSTSAGTNPYEVSAIGDPETMASKFLASPEVNSLAVISETFGLRFDFSRKDELTLPAANTPELRIAAPEAPAGATPATDPRREAYP